MWASRGTHVKYQSRAKIAAGVSRILQSLTRKPPDAMAPIRYFSLANRSRQVEWRKWL